MTDSITAILGVKDERELIAASVAHLHRIGVNHVCVLDYGSRDGTVEIVRDLCRHGAVSLHHVDPDVVVDYETWSAHDLALARETGADWILVLDADEFWLPASGSLRDSPLLSTADIISVERYNVVLTPGGLLMPEVAVPAVYDQVHLFTRRVPSLRDVLAAHPAEPFITFVPLPKVVGRVAHAAAIDAGGHGLRPLYPRTRRAVATDAIVAHVPFSTWPRFVRKVENIRAELVRHPSLFASGYAWHWRRWAAMTPSELAGEFDRQIAPAPQLSAWFREGVVQTAAALIDSPASRAAPRETADGESLRRAARRTGDQPAAALAPLVP